MAKKSDKCKPKPGDLLERHDGITQHWGVCTDKGVVHLTPGDDASSSKIATEKTVPGTVSEVDFDTFAREKKVSVHQTTAPAQETIARARGKIGSHPYNLSQYNCEHFAKEAAGERQSGQVENAERMAKNILEHIKDNQTF
ncbi:phospholipase A and acyltransferase 3-like [Chiloscyllium punctatum]|uniref:phospholipase A and acyltransferase 3-like n=1 Tax=Chiloscyllium punctatum TaxID=137246 RepID=UPI003B63AA78